MTKQLLKSGPYPLASAFLTRTSGRKVNSV